MTDVFRGLSTVANTVVPIASAMEQRIIECVTWVMIIMMMMWVSVQVVVMIKAVPLFARRAVSILTTS